MGATLPLASLPSSGSLNDQMCHFVVILQSIFCRSVPASLGAAEIRCLSSRVCIVASVEQTDQHGICAQCSHSIQIQELLLGKQGTRTLFPSLSGAAGLGCFPPTPAEEILSAWGSEASILDSFPFSDDLHDLQVHSQSSLYDLNMAVVFFLQHCLFLSRFAGSIHC